MNGLQKEELLGKQLELLAEESKKSASAEELAALTHAMCEVCIMRSNP